MFTKRPALNSTSSKKSLMLIFLVWVQMDLWQCGWCYLCRCVTLQCTADRSFDCFKTDETKRRRRGECARRRHASIAVRWLCTVCTVCTGRTGYAQCAHSKCAHAGYPHVARSVHIGYAQCTQWTHWLCTACTCCLCTRLTRWLHPSLSFL